MEAKFEEERRCRMEIEAKLEQERKLREEQSVMLHSMVTWMQGLGASMNYATPPPPFALPAQPYFPAGPSDTPNQSWNASNDPPPDQDSPAAPWQSWPPPLHLTVSDL
ncbi:uncharacterized protein LOC120696133 isoform X1 [Panicum virgatum]|uniref:uncharacterized protein LOC120696133 isoform X1 n=1 Tax=Panicum virgatum TaxID=38727 RepID=UPI0019D5FB33|nr:uncharacterized protein LOC120696133 isoform X1 [Panicum virgatum]XP_039835211.1 uncharacterized protein LOC120696133 isoform X1 [Panicum virgatum]